MKIRSIYCSYQWDKQDFVRKVFEDLHSRQVQTWFDIWGSMKGGTNDAMATGQNRFLIHRNAFHSLQVSNVQKFSLLFFQKPMSHRSIVFWNFVMLYNVEKLSLFSLLNPMFRWNHGC